VLALHGVFTFIDGLTNADAPGPDSNKSPVIGEAIALYSK